MEVRIWFCRLKEEADSKLARAPKTFNHAEVIEGHGCEEELGGIQVACL